MVDRAVDGEMDVLEAEGLRAAFSSGIQVFRWPKEPVEGDDDEVDDVGVGNAEFGMFSLEDVNDGADNGDVGRVGA